MKDKNRKNALSSNTFLTFLAIAMLTTAVTKTAMAKSLYVIADIKGSSIDRTQPVQAYDIGVDGTLIFQAQHDIPHSMLGAVGMAIDSDYGYVFITYEASGDIQLIEATTMIDAGTTRAPGASDLAGIVYDHKNSLLYCVDRGKNNLYVYNWFPDTATLIHTPGSPFSLENASAYGIALDEIDDLLYVASARNTITVYSTSDWSLVDTISISRIAISIAVDVTNGFVYTGGGFAGNMFLTQYHLPTGIEAEVQVEPDAGVMGLAVDTDTGLVYMGTGSNNAPGGDNLLVYDAALNQIDIVTAIGNPSGLAIPGKDIGYNPLNLNKLVLRGASASTDFDEMKTVGAGDTYTYGISFENNNDYSVTDVTIVDILPDEVTFVTADDDGVNGYYDYDEKTRTQTYTWSYEELPPGSSTLLEITVQVNPDIDADRIITNSVTINSNETAPTTTSVDVMTTSNALNLKKSILVPDSIEGQVTRVEAGDTIKYAIRLDNKDNDFPVTNVTVVDELPKDVNYINPDDKNYDAKSHTYTWKIDSLEPGDVVQLELEVSVNQNVAVGTTITNIVTVESDETPKSSASVDAVVLYKPLNISKKTFDSSGSEEIMWINPGESFIYQIRFDNDNDFPVTNVTVVDKLPEDVNNINPDDKNYDAKSRTYTWKIDSLEPGDEVQLELEVSVNQNVAVDTTITNIVTVKSDETELNEADVDIHVGEINFRVDNLSITPNVLRRNGTSRNIMVEMYPRKFKKSDIDRDDRPELYYQDKLIDKRSQSLSGSENRPKITILFNRAKLMDALYGYGEFKLRVEGRLTKDRTYDGEAIIHVTRFAGD